MFKKQILRLLCFKNNFIEFSKSKTHLVTWKQNIIFPNKKMFGNYGCIHVFAHYFVFKKNHDYTIINKK